MEDEVDAEGVEILCVEEEAIDVEEAGSYGGETVLRWKGLVSAFYLSSSCASSFLAVLWVFACDIMAGFVGCRNLLCFGSHDEKRLADGGRC